MTEECWTRKFRCKRGLGISVQVSDVKGPGSKTLSPDSTALVEDDDLRGLGVAAGSGRSCEGGRLEDHLIFWRRDRSCERCFRERIHGQTRKPTGR